MAPLTGKRWPVIGNRIHPDFPYIDAQIRYGVLEHVCNAVDMIAPRFRLSFPNVQETLPVVFDIIVEELKWSKHEKQFRPRKLTKQFLALEMGQAVKRIVKDQVNVNLSSEEVKTYVKRFEIIDKDKKGYVSINHIRRAVTSYGDGEICGEKLHEILKEIDTNTTAQVELDEYLQMMSAIKTGEVSYARFARMAVLEVRKEEAAKFKRKITVDRSGGGL
ncbi:glycerol-3-phosphate dehydrogenase, mitochondrial-like [Glossina fuscipes fuscipes]